MRNGRSQLIKKYAKQTGNIWANTHKLLSDEKKKEVIEKIIGACQWSQATVYRRMKEPESLREFEKKAIALIYKKKVEIFFPVPELIKV